MLAAASKCGANCTAKFMASVLDVRRAPGDSRWKRNRKISLPAELRRLTARYRMADANLIFAHGRGNGNCLAIQHK
jgi:hypothetical protein